MTLLVSSYTNSVRIIFNAIFGLLVDALVYLNLCLLIDHFKMVSGPAIEPGYRRIITYNNDYYNGSHTSKVNII
jgi:hypothetical protein